MIPKRVIKYLEKNNTKYETVEHRTVFTAHDLAITLKLKHSQIAKSLLIKADKDYILAVVSADRNLDFKKLAKLAGVKKVDLPKEGVMKTKFKVKPGALPAFGGLYKLPVFVDKSLLKEKKVLLAAGSFTESIKMSPKEYVKVEEATLGIFSVVKKIKKQKIVKAKKKPVKKVVKKKKK